MNFLFVKTADQPIRVGWFPANCVQLQSGSIPSIPIASYQNTAGTIEEEKKIGCFFVYKIFLMFRITSIYRYISI